jgi:hypothetical protein
MTTKLLVFNEALRILGNPILSSVDQAGEDARQLRDAYIPSVMACYEAGNWKSAIIRAELSRLATTPSWGYSYYYALPADFVRVVDISETGAIGDDLDEYVIENGNIATNAETVYLRYISSELVTLTPGEWTQAFADFVSATMAVRCAPKLNAAALEAASQFQEKYRLMALAVDAIQNPPARRKPGTFVKAVRYGARYNGGRY